MGLRVRIELKVPSYFFLHLDFFCLHGMQCLLFLLLFILLKIYIHVCVFVFVSFILLLCFMGLFLSLSLFLSLMIYQNPNPKLEFSSCLSHMWLLDACTIQAITEREVAVIELNTFSADSFLTRINQICELKAVKRSFYFSVYQQYY